MSQTPDERRERIKEVFAIAMSADPLARLEKLDESCAGDAELRKSVEDLLKNYESAQQFFAQFPQDFARQVVGFTDAPRTFSAGDLVAARFHIVGFLGAGGMGEVYEAEDLLLDHQHVALKTLPADIAADAPAIASLTREMALARQVTHLNVCRVFDVYQHAAPSGATIAFFTMELLPGETLAARLLRSGPLSTTDAWPLVRQMAAALGAAHTAGVVHGDFKPGNVVLVPSPDGGERLVVTDFGLARRAAADTASRSVNSTGVARGTPAYMAPEQFAGRRATRATDVYALAAVVFEMVTGKQAFESDPADPAFSMALDPSWRSAILRCLDRNPEARLQTVGELLTALSDSDSRSSVRWRWAAGLACLGLAALLLVPPVRATLGAKFQGVWAGLSATPPSVVETEQSVAVLAFTSADRTPDGEAFSRGLAAALSDQLGAVLSYKPGLLFVPTVEMIDTGENSPPTVRVRRAHRILGADLIVTGRVDRTAAPRQIGLELYDASAQPPTLMRSGRVEVGDGDRLLPSARTEVARMLGVRPVPPAIPALDASGARPAEAEALYVRGRGYLEEGRPPRLDVARLHSAVAAFQQAMALDGQYAPAHAALSETLVLEYEASKNIKKDTTLLDKAERSADDACRLQPKVAHFHVVRALAYLATGRHDLAIPALEAALRIDPDAVGARENLAKSYTATAQLPLAERTLENGVTRHPQSWSAHVDLGTFRLNHGDYKRAGDHYRMGLQYAPDNPRAISNLGVLYAMTEQFDAAEQELLKGLKLAPDDPLLHNNLAWMYFYEGNFPNGVDSMKKAVVLLKKDDSVVLAGLARGYRWMDRKDEARGVYDRAIAAAGQQLRADPMNVEVRANLAYLNAEAGNPGEAVRQIQRALDDSRGSVRVRFTSALVFELTESRDEALDALKLAIEGGHPTYQIAHHPDFRTLRADRRYPLLMRRLAGKR